MSMQGVLEAADAALDLAAAALRTAFADERRRHERHTDRRRAARHRYRSAGRGHRG
ncbi:hypothetical protein ACU4GD_05810 [Cupriavidus basilensis]